MIFVTVGTDLPFDRLIRVVDQWSYDAARSDVFAQIGLGGWEPPHIPFSRFLEPQEFIQRMTSATLIVSHAGMGTILSALRYEKPILVMPRRASLGEQRNEHQLATARHLLAMEKINVAFNECELIDHLNKLDGLRAQSRIGAFASPELCSAVRHFIDHGAA